MKNKIIYRREHLIKIQSFGRMCIAKNRHQPRFKGIMKIRTLQSQLTRLREISNQLKSSRDKSVAEIQKLQGLLDQGINQIKVIILVFKQNK